jgi:integrase/recombinase XerD
MSESPAFPALVQYFFAQHLSAHKKASPRTVAAYRDTFRLFLAFLQDRTGRSPANLSVADLDAPAVLAFLQHLESDRRNEVRSRNARLCAIRSFFRVVSIRDPASIAVVNRVLAIPSKRTDRPLITFLTREEIDALLAAPDQTTWLGSRDHALLLALYNTGARASEITALLPREVTFGAQTLVELHGKGRKERTVPLWPQTGRVLQRWFQKLPAGGNVPAFPTTRGTVLSADALDHLIQKAVSKAALRCPSLKSKRITPHVVRHTTAMHLLQSGVDIAVIALWLGHESIETTHGYVEADLSMKQRALDKLAPANGRLSRFRPADELMQFLSHL